MDRTGPAHLLWTSGWDSTFRLLELLCTTTREVVPHYVLDSDRASTVMELKTMEAIVARIRRDMPDAAGRLHPHRLVLKSDVPEVPDITARYRRLHAETNLGSQYDWLARYAHALGDVRLELGIIHSGGKASRLLREFLATRDGVAVLNDSAPDDLRIFAPFEFPIAHRSKPNMAEEAKGLGVFDILSMSWFCHNPWRGRPCGTCVPCRDAVMMGMAYRLPPTTRLRRAIHGIAPLQRVRSVMNRFISDGR